MAKVLGAVGHVCIVAGVLILLFVAYQLWGTGLHEAQAQNSLQSQFEDQLREAGVQPGETADQEPAASPPATDEPTPPPPPPDDGSAAANLSIPKIGLDKIVVEGVTVDDLKRGPGHYPGSPMPGQAGNSAIAGHRTTYGAPFHRIDELSRGDEILVTTLQGTFRYLVSEQSIVTPDQLEVLDDVGDNRLTLTACHPKYSARERIIVVAQLDETPAPAPPPPDNGPASQPEQVELDAGLSGQRSSAGPAILLGLACGLIWLGAWVASRLMKRWVAYAVATPIFLVVLFFFYESFSRLLPANF